MFTSEDKKITTYAHVFLEPKNSTHRQYEALRAYFVDGVSSAEAARRFGYTTGSFRVLCHQFRQNPEREFFLPPSKGPRTAPKTEPVRERVIMLRKQNLSVYDIAAVLADEGHSLSPPAIWTILKEEGFARLPRRRDEDRPGRAGLDAAPVADVRELNLSPRSFRTKVGGLFLFVPFLASISLDDMLAQAGFPGSGMVPADCAVRSLLALKLWGNARHSHVMSDVFDEGLALFAGLNAIPKRTFLTEYSCRVHPAALPVLMRLWFDGMNALGIQRGRSFDLDFHTIPFHGEDALVEKHYVSKRSRRQKGVLAFLAQDGDTRVFCYANAQVRKDSRNDEILQFIEFWKERTGCWPDELVFDSKLTTYRNLHELNTRGISFITIRRRSKMVLNQIAQTPTSAWRRITLSGVTRAFKTPKILDTTVTLRDYAGPIRQLTVSDLGHEQPTLILTNQLRKSPAKIIGRYAQRMLIENNIADGIDFFHMDSLSSAVALKIDCDLQITLMASSLYRFLGQTIGAGYQSAHSRRIFRDFISSTATIQITDNAIRIHFSKRAHNPLLLNSGFGTIDTPIPWLGGKRLQFILD